MTVDQAAAYLGIWPTLVRRYAQQGRLPGRKIADIWIFSRQDVEDFAQRPRPNGVHRSIQQRPPDDASE